jgi:hypothetical protein
MVVGHSCLKNAARLLAEWNGSRDRLGQAAEFCWLAGFWFLPDWPEPLREQYGEIFRPLIGEWTFSRAIRELNDDAARVLAATLSEFSAAALRRVRTTELEH